MLYIRTKRKLFEMYKINVQTCTQMCFLSSIYIMLLNICKVFIILIFISYFTMKIVLYFEH